MSLANYIKDDYITFGGKSWHKSKVSEQNLRNAIKANPRLLKEGWVVNSKGQVVSDPKALTVPPVGIGGGGGPVPQAPSTPAPAATPSLVDLIKDKYVTFGSKTWDKTKVSSENLLNAIRANPRLLVGGWQVNGSGQIVRTPTPPAGGGPVPQAPSTPAPTAAVPPPPPPPSQAQFGNYQDADYWLGLNDLRNQLGLIQNPDGSLVSQAAQARLAQLRQQVDPNTFKPVTGGVGGKTLYDILYGQQQQQDSRNITLSRSDAAKKGVLSSGYTDRTLTDLAGKSAAETDQLVRNYGVDLNDSRSAAYQASQSQADLLKQYQQAQGNLALAASNRGYQNAMNQYQQTYGGY